MVGNSHHSSIYFIVSVCVLVQFSSWVGIANQPRFRLPGQRRSGEHLRRAGSAKPQVRPPDYAPGEQDRSARQRGLQRQDSGLFRPEQEPGESLESRRAGNLLLRPRHQDLGKTLRQPIAVERQHLPRRRLYLQIRAIRCSFAEKSSEIAN